MDKKWAEDIKNQARKLHVLASIAMGAGFSAFGVAGYFVNEFEVWVHLTSLRALVILLIIPTALLTHYRRIHVNILGYVNILSMSLFLSYMFSSTISQKPDRLALDIFIFFIASAFGVIWHWKHTIIVAVIFTSFHLPLALSNMSWADFLNYNALWTIITPFLVSLIVHYRFSFTTKEIVMRHRLMEQNEEINQQKEELSTQHQTVSIQKNQLNRTYQQLRDSIRYAKRIQDALLPPQNFLEQHFTESFVYFKPRDIVSGDFYWFADKGDKVIVIVADCTGHGIPGALMSMIGDSVLNQTIHDSEIHSPETVLGQLHQRIQITLRQTENSSRDGMDLVILVLYKTEKFGKYAYAEYAGAMNPIFYVQENELHEIKGTKKAIGGDDQKNKHIFEKHRIELEKPTTFYLFSDGFQDQFGGINVTKYNIGNFRSLILSLSTLALEEQKITLEETYKAWTNEEKTPQIDDILIIGLKV